VSSSRGESERVIQVGAGRVEKQTGQKDKFKRTAMDGWGGGGGFGSVSKNRAQGGEKKGNGEDSGLDHLTNIGQTAGGRPPEHKEGFAHGGESKIQSKTGSHRRSCKQTVSSGRQRIH